MKGSKGTQMSSIENGKINRVKCDCSRCKEYLKTNPLCKLGRDTSNNKYCKWFYAVKSKGTKISPQKTTTNVKNSSAKHCIGCTSNQAGFCLLHKRWALHVRNTCIEMKEKTITSQN